MGRPSHLVLFSIVLFVSVLLFAHSSNSQPTSVATPPIDPKDIADYTIVNGAQLRGRLDQLMSTDRNVRAAVAYYEQKRMKVFDNGLVEAKFRRVSTKEEFNLFFVSFQEPTPTPTVQNLALWAQGPRGAKTIVATVSLDKEPEVKEEQVVVEGKIQPAPKPSLKNYLKCALGSCGSAALGCTKGGPAWPQCFALWCGGGVLTCGALELFMP